MAGDRFILLNSVAVVTVVFCCDNGCEYKIGGSFVILGEEGNNFSIIYPRLEKYKIKSFAENFMLLVWQVIDISCEFLGQ